MTTPIYGKTLKAFYRWSLGAASLAAAHPTSFRFDAEDREARDVLLALLEIAGIDTDSDDPDLFNMLPAAREHRAATSTPETWAAAKARVDDLRRRIADG